MRENKKVTDVGVHWPAQALSCCEGAPVGAHAAVDRSIQSGQFPECRCGGALCKNPNKEAACWPRRVTSRRRPTRPQPKTRCVSSRPQARRRGFLRFEVRKRPGYSGGGAVCAVELNHFLPCNATLKQRTKVNTAPLNTSITYHSPSTSVSDCAEGEADPQQDQELERVTSGARPLSANGSATTNNRNNNEERRFADIIKEKPIKVTVRVLVPVKEHPKFNFVGKLLGPKGNSLKRLQEDTMTKMAVLGRGSMRDKAKEEELRASSDPKYAHFNDDLHVEITAFAPPAEAHARIAYALAEVRKFLVPDYNDEIRQEQMREMQLLSAPSAVAASAGADVLSPASPAGSPTAAAAGYLYQPQQLLLHPAFRGLAAARPAALRSGGSILSRLRPARSRPVLPLLSRDGSEAEAQPDVVDPAVSPAPAPQLYNLYDSYAAAAAAGYGLLDGYVNGGGLIAPETMEELSAAAAAPEAVATSVTPDLTGRADASVLKMDRTRYRHDPYARYTGLKLPL
ncbi:KH domain-containing, RNA-binding, signal transduction-associated protein 3-like [Schistocerca piceifrons]|uniref:KH domain-containing, RNA-binding, signal transduction-associated protein 3-like n=1 Tax=Schistocerca piceifrons TaxID=274613 RepID=UPI001F5E619C|nr:KH domain-containing, RNA-binding, signal transduction-associated protein 3-like [Schistocerca piceifrons]